MGGGMLPIESCEAFNVDPTPAPRDLKFCSNHRVHSGYRRPVTLADANNFLANLKQRFIDEPDKYDAFLAIMRDYSNASRTSIRETLAQCADLLRDHPDLLSEFVTFVPPCYADLVVTSAMPWRRDGSTDFASLADLVHADPFRFAVSVNQNKLTLELEDRATGRRWRSEPMGIEEFTTVESRIPRALTQDYAERFVACLQGDQEHASATFKRFLASADPHRLLTLELKLAVAGFEAWLTYMFWLMPVASSAVE